MPTCETRGDASAHLAGLGAVHALERRLAAQYGMTHALCMPSATTGLLALGLALDLRRSQFVTTPLTYGGSLAAWMALGAQPRFRDVDAEALTLDPAGLQRLPRRTGAILAVDLFGHPCDDAALRAIADAAGIPLVVDGAQSLGARRCGRAAGSRATAVVLSFTAGKPLDAGEGGAVLTNDPDLYARLVWHSQHPYRQKRELGLHATNEFAINGRMAPIVAAELLGRFDAALEAVAERRRRADAIRRALRNSDLVEVPDIGRCAPSWYRLTVRWLGRARPRELQQSLAAAGIVVTVGELPINVLCERSVRCPAARREYRRRCWIAFGQEVQ